MESGVRSFLVLGSRESQKIALKCPTRWKCIFIWYFRSLPGGPIEKPKHSFVHQGLLKLSYKFHSVRIKIVGLRTFGAKDQKWPFGEL